MWGGAMSIPQLFETPRVLRPRCQVVRVLWGYSIPTECVGLPIVLILTIEKGEDL